MLCDVCSVRKRSQKDKDDKQTDKHREEEQTPQQKNADKSKEQRAFVMPADPALLQYIEQCVEHIRPLTSTLQQATGLARSHSTCDFLLTEHLLCVCVSFGLT